MIPRALFLIVSLLLVNANCFLAQETDSAILFKQAVDAADRGSFEEAVALMESVRSVYSDNLNVLWNLGIWHAELENYREALAIWKQYRKIDPREWRVRAKLIQSYQDLGQLDRRDEEREALLEWYSQTSDASRPRQKFFCRDQFDVNGVRVMAYELFDPSGDMRVFYRFSVLNADGNEAFWYSLGSYDLTTSIAREVGEIGDNERLYHFDRYEKASHQTLGFFKKMPAYDVIKENVTSALSGKGDTLHEYADDE